MQFLYGIIDITIVEAHSNISNVLSEQIAVPFFNSRFNVVMFYFEFLKLRAVGAN
jgi:hypothetical protein